MYLKAPATHLNWNCLIGLVFFRLNLNYPTDEFFWKNTCNTNTNTENNANTNTKWLFNINIAVVYKLKFALQLQPVLARLYSVPKGGQRLKRFDWRKLILLWCLGERSIEYCLVGKWRWLALFLTLTQTQRKNKNSLPAQPQIFFNKISPKTNKNLVFILV